MVGIDLSTTRCALIEVNAPGRGRRRAAAPGADVRVRSFVTLPDGTESPDRLTAGLRALLAGNALSRHCWVTLWGVRSSHQFLLLPAAAPSSLEALARREARQGVPIVQIEASDVVTGVMSGAVRESATRAPWREVSVVTASSSDIRARLQPILDAGFTVEGVTTPSLALCSIARNRRASVPGAASAYVAIGPFAIALAIVRDGLPVLAREISWGYQGELGRRDGAPLAAEALAQRLSSELRRSFLFFKQSSKQDVSQVLMCGALPGLRSLTAPLIEILDVEVETLDSLEGVDADALPEPADRFREQVADLRLALAISADPAPPANLLPASLKAPREAGRRRLLFGAGMAAAVIVSALVWGRADQQARAAERQAQDLDRQVSALGPRARRMQAERDDAALESARRAALTAFDVQGPRVARVLETLARLAPDEVTLRSLTASPDGTSWRLSVEGFASSSNPARARDAVSGFLRGLQDSPYFGAPIRPPWLRVTSARGTPDLNPARAAGEPGDSRRPSPATGTTDIEFVVGFAIRK